MEGGDGVGEKGRMSGSAIFMLRETSGAGALGKALVERFGLRLLASGGAAEALERRAAGSGSKGGKALRKRYLERMFDLTSYFKQLKQEFGHWMRKHRGGKPLAGVWMSRFQGKIVAPGDGSMSSPSSLKQLQTGC